MMKQLEARGGGPSSGEEATTFKTDDAMAGKVAEARQFLKHIEERKAKEQDIINRELQAMADSRNTKGGYCGC